MPAQQILLGLGAKDYEIERSIRNDQGTADTNSGSNFSRTFGSSGNRRTFTNSIWVKKCRTPGNVGDDKFSIISAGGGGSGSSALDLFFKTNDCLRYGGGISGSSSFQLETNRVFRDPSAWYHIVTAVDTTQSTESNRVKIYINGVQETSFSTETYPSQNLELYFNFDVIHRLGSDSLWSNLSSTYGNLNGYLAEYHFIDGTALTPSSFGKTNSKTGQWVPVKYSGSYGTNGVYLNFSDNSDTTATTLGKDSSGNSNNFTPNGYSVTAGKDDDSMFDTPTNNFPTLSSIDKSLVGTMSNGNLRVSYNYKPASKTFRSTMDLPSSGKFYWEWENEEASSNPGRWATGLVRYTNEAGVVDVQGYNDADYLSVSYGGSMWNGTTHVNPAWSSPPTFYSGERVAIAIDCSNGKVWVGKVASNGSTTWYDDDGTTDGDPAGGTNETCTIADFSTGNWMPVVVWHDGGSASSTTFTSNINFGNHSFLGTVPTGFEKLCSANLPEPTIALPDNYFDTLLYTGDGNNSRNITGLEFTPDMVWIKSRSNTDPHVLQDITRTNGVLYPDQNSMEGNTGGGWISSFNSNGITINSNGPINTNSQTYVAWNWKAGGSPSSNTNGSITSSVSANTTAGFSILTYTGTGSQTTVGHGLGVKPKVIITKLRDTNTQDWMFYPKQLTGTGGTYLKFNEGNGVATDAHTYPNVEPTTTVYTVGGDDGGDGTNGNGKAYVAYCFNEVAGYSKFGKYTGNGNADGSFIYTGFRPAYIVIKNTTAGHQWVIYDSVRQPSNVCGLPLYVNNTYVEDTNTSVTPFDIVSNGFKPRSTWNELNQNGSSIIYMAFAESPFKYSRAR